MAADPSIETVRLPAGWPAYVKSAVLHAISLAHLAVTYARGRVTESGDRRAGLAAELERAREQISLLQEELRIKDVRMARVDPHRRPRYRPTDRLAILELRAASGWSQAQTADRFQIQPGTIASWMKRVDEGGEFALVQTPEPVNRFPDFVRHLVRRLKVLCPQLGKKKIERKPVMAKYVNHTWHTDLTVVPTAAGFWTPWLPHALTQTWPFCWWVACVVDHFSRRAIGFAVFSKQPTSLQVRTFLGRVMSRVQVVPKYLMCDRGRAVLVG